MRSALLPVHLVGLARLVARVAPRLLAVGALAVSLRAPLAAQAAGAPDTRPGVAILYFTNGALTSTTDYAPLSKGMAEMLITELAQNPSIRVVERTQLQRVIDEQNLGSGNRVDKETAVRIGKILGAQHLLMGAFVIDPHENLRIDVRSVNAETSQIEYVETISGKAERLLPMVSELGAKVNAGLKLPPLRGGARRAATEPRGPDQFRAMMLMSRALERQDKGDSEGAIALYKQALQTYPDFERAKVLLASLEGTPKQTP
jgi:curli biogenesis system outer membrane secretion channel CsgG